jgi:hypothetical protein
MPGIYINNPQLVSGVNKNRPASKATNKLVKIGKDTLNSSLKPASSHTSQTNNHEVVSVRTHMVPYISENSATPKASSTYMSEITHKAGKADTTERDMGGVPGLLIILSIAAVIGLAYLFYLIFPGIGIGGGFIIVLLLIIIVAVIVRASS